MPYENQTIILIFSRMLSFNWLRTTRTTLSARHNSTYSCRAEPEPEPEAEAEPKPKKTNNMDYFNYRKQRAFRRRCCCAGHYYQHGSPCYIYSRATLERHWKAFELAFGDHPHLICYAVKANSNIACLICLPV